MIRLTPHYTKIIKETWCLTPDQQRTLCVRYYMMHTTSRYLYDNIRLIGHKRYLRHGQVQHEVSWKGSNVGQDDIYKLYMQDVISGRAVLGEYTKFLLSIRVVNTPDLKSFVLIRKPEKLPDLSNITELV